MRRTTTLLILIGAWGAANGQCTIAIPSNATTVTTLQGTLTVSGQSVWVCDGGLAAVTGNNNTVFVESMGVGSIIGDNNTLITKASGTYVSGNNNEVFILDPDNVADLGTGTQITTCAEVVFTYANAPANGCFSVGIATPAEVSFELFPNPATNELNVAIPGVRIERIRLVDLQGRIVLDRSGSRTGKLDISSLVPGVFLFVADTDHGRFTRQLVKN